MQRVRIIEFVAPGIEAIALGLGCFEAAGVRVDVTRTRSSTEQRDALLADECEIGLTAIDNVIAWNELGADLRLIAQVERTTLLDLIAQPQIDSLASLRGATIAVDAVDTGFAIALRHLLQTHGVSFTDYTMKPVGGPPERLAAVQAGDAEAGLVGPPWTGQAQELGMRTVISLHDALPDFPGIGVVVKASRIGSLRPALAAYLRALDQAVRWTATTARSEVLGVLAQAGFVAAGGEAVLGVCPPSLKPPTAGLELLFTMRRELGLLPPAFSAPEEILDLSLLPVIRHEIRPTPGRPFRR